MTKPLDRDAVQVPLVHAVDPNEAGQFVGLRGTAIADRTLDRVGLLRHRALFCAPFCCGI